MKLNPMSTAPRDGTPIVVRVAERGGAYFGGFVAGDLLVVEYQLHYESWSMRGLIAGDRSFDGWLPIGVADPAYLIWSHEHGLWWRGNSAGYTSLLEQAGRYLRNEALLICGDARGGWRRGKAPSEIPVLLADALAVMPGGAQ